MRARLLLLFTVVNLAACAAPVARQYYAACLEAGHNQGECKMRAIDVNRQAWAQFSHSLQGAGNSFQQAQPANMLTHCRTTDFGWSSRTTCQ